MGIITTAGENFSHAEQIDLARLIWKRFGREPEAAHAAWQRMLQNGSNIADYTSLVFDPMHTPHCTGECLQCDVAGADRFDKLRCQECGKGYLGRTAQRTTDAGTRSTFRCDRCGYLATVYEEDES